jgi:acetyl esterase/lipase
LDYVSSAAAGYSASRHKLDIFYPASGAGPFPVVVFFHAGGFTGGDHRTCRTAGFWARRVFEVNNCVLVSAGYRLAPGDAFPAQRYDAGAAIRWLRANAGGLALDMERAGLMPYSSGALIGTHLALTADNPTFAHAAFGNTDRSEAVRACAAFAGPYRISTEEAQQVARFGSVVRAVASTSSPEGQLIGNLNPYDVPSGGVAAASVASPYTYVGTATATSPRFDLRAGENDQTVVADQATELASALTAAGYTATSTLYAGEGHNITANTTITDDLVDDLCSYLLSL